ncbi:hypothetical protein DFJ74DRAFT_697578 [Hyaloraphidium curvatum]|nr:hypothetical protein DFJ74DRAFT_697578 [Hyaloraphidium curvatum]
MPSSVSNIKENLEALGVKFGSLGVQSPTWVADGMPLPGIVAHRRRSSSEAAKPVPEPEPVPIPVEDKAVQERLEPQEEPAPREEKKVEEEAVSPQRVDRAEAATQVSQAAGATNGPLGSQESSPTPADKPVEPFAQQPAGLEIPSLGTNANQAQQLYSAINGLGAGGLWPSFNPALNDYLAMYGFNQPAGSMNQTPELNALAAMNSMRAMMGYPYDPNTYAQTAPAMPAAQSQQPRQPSQLAPGRAPEGAGGQRFGPSSTQSPDAGFPGQPAATAAPAMPGAQPPASYAAQPATGSAAAQLGGMPFYAQQPFYAYPPQYGYPGAGASQPSLGAYGARGYGMYSGAGGSAAPGGGAPAPGPKPQASAGAGYYGYGFGPEGGQGGAGLQQSQLGDYGKNLYGMSGAGFGGFAGQGLGGQEGLGGQPKQLGGYGKQQGGYDSQMSGPGSQSKNPYGGPNQGQSYNQGYYQGGRSQGYAGWNQQN